MKKKENKTKKKKTTARELLGNNFMDMFDKRVRAKNEKYKKDPSSYNPFNEGE